MTIKEMMEALDRARDYADEGKSEAHDAWDKADDACSLLADMDSDYASDAWDKADEARSAATRARDYADSAYDLIDSVYYALEDMGEDAVVLDGEGSAADEYAPASGLTTLDPLALLRGLAGSPSGPNLDTIRGEGGSITATLAIVLPLAAIGFLAVWIMPLAWSLLPLSILALAIFWVRDARIPLGAGRFSGYAARAIYSAGRDFLGTTRARFTRRRPMPVAFILGGPADIAEVGGRLYLFTDHGWGEIEAVSGWRYPPSVGAADVLEWDAGPYDRGPDESPEWDYPTAPAAAVPTLAERLAPYVGRGNR